MKLSEEKTKEIVSGAIHNKMDEIFSNIAETLEDVAKTEKAKAMTGPEALRHCADLLRKTKKS